MKQKQSTKDKRSKSLMGRPGNKGATGFKHSNEERKARSERKAGLWQIQTPQDEILVIKNLTTYCKVNNLKYFDLYKSRYGWKCKKIESKVNE